MTRTNYDSDFCGSVPIQLINLIQPYGVLVIIRREDHSIIQISENASEVFGVPHTDLIDTRIENHITGKGGVDLLNNTDNQNKIPSVWEINNRPFLALLHSYEKYFIVEFDKSPYDDSQQLLFVDVYREIKYAMSLIQSSPTIEDAARNCAREIKRISGFDKVMVYHFDNNWNGTVIAEQGEPDMESYLGITFPASDIPQQARKLYEKNAYRFIPTRDYQPVRLFPVINPITGSFVDLSDCNLRSVPAVHLEYLANMNVTSSMSTRIMNGDTLWGLIACHHKTEKELSFEVRSIFELLSSVVSARMASLLNSDVHRFSIRIKEQYKNLVEEAYRKGNDNISTALLEGDPDLLTLFSAQGAAISLGGKVHFIGEVPEREQLRELLLWLHAKQLRNVYATDSLPNEYDQAPDFSKVASGMLVIPVDFENDEYIILFRPECIRTVTWGGNPEERIRFDGDSRNYHPRASFAKWKELVKDTSKPWREEEISAAESLRSFIYEFSKLAT